jgi:beta-glucosidase
MNVALIEEAGRAIGMEMEEFGVTLLLAPGMNIHRNPLCGRNFEYYSEDPLLTGKMAAAMTRGVQSLPGIGTTIKHFACNNQEANRNFTDSILSERALREIYLKGFEIAIKESQPMAVMSSYNLINGVRTANSWNLCTQVLRKEWGFQGVVMTDWLATFSGKSSPVARIESGNDLMMPGQDSDFDQVLRAASDGNLDLEKLKGCAMNIIDIILKSNRYEDCQPYLSYFRQD